MTDPTPLRVLAACALVATLSACAGDGDPRSASLPDLAALDTVAIVGVAEGPAEQVIGRIIDVAAAADGSFFVLDAQSSAVGWFGADGGYRGGITSRGQGPGELSRPTALAFMGDRLAVMDPRNARLGLYRPGSQGIEYLHALSGSFSTLDAVRNLCGLDGRWYVRSRSDGMMIHAVDSTGVVLRSFQQEVPVDAETFGPFLDVVRPQISAGHIACMHEPPTVVSVETFTRVVRAYGPEGELRWERELEGIRPLRFEISERGGLGLSDPLEEGSHAGRSIVGWNEESVLVQYAVELPGSIPEGQDYHGVVSIELSLATGEELGRTDALPLVAETAGDLVYAFENEPYPRVIVLRRN
jgi:hypothetical protein